MTQRDGPRDQHRGPTRGPTQGTHTEGTHTGDPHRGPKQGTHTEGRAPQRTHHRRGGPNRGPTQDTHRHLYLVLIWKILGISWATVRPRLQILLDLGRFCGPCSHSRPRARPRSHSRPRRLALYKILQLSILYGVLHMKGGGRGLGHILPSTKQGALSDDYTVQICAHLKPR